ncbi:MAG: UbiH/UbiF/VisC/COQ6 family ubiquinone biosynthesis hydroxylase [Dokdonella sp.]
MSQRGLIDAVIVGAGPVGAVLALALAKEGLSIALVEANEPSPWQADVEVDARVVALASDSITLLSDLDVWSEIATRRASPYRRMTVWDALAPGELSFDAAERGEAALGAIVENRLVQHVLWQALQKHSTGASINAVQLRCPSRVISIDSNDESVSVQLDDDETLRCKILIAADGAGSGLRELAGIGTRGHAYEQRAMVAHVTTTRPHEDTAWQRFLPGGPLAFLPLSDGRCSIVWSLPDDEAQRILALDDKQFRDELGCALDMRLGPITTTTPRAAFPLRLNLAERYVAGRCVLVGDAAHVVHPLAGQGMNLGFRDVICLRRELAGAVKRGVDPGSAHVLRRYERERRSENTVGAYGFDLIGKVYRRDSLALATLRGAALGLAGKFAPLRRRLADAASGRL